MKSQSISDAETYERPYGELVLLAGIARGDMKTVRADLKILRIQPGHSTSFHRHLIAESIFHILSGEIECQFDSIGTIRFANGNTFVVPPGECHKIRNCGASVAEVLEVESPPHDSTDKYPHEATLPNERIHRHIGQFWRDAPGVRIKICGVKNVDTAFACHKLGVSAIGIRGMSVARETAPFERIRSWAPWLAVLPDDLSIFLLTDVTDLLALRRLISWSNCDTVQLQKSQSFEAIETIQKISSFLRPNGWKLVKSIGIEGYNQGWLREYISAIEPHVDAILLDTSDKGGTGQTHDWSVSRALCTSTHLPVILAGGLKPINVGDAIRVVNPHAIDVESGVEHLYLQQGGRVTVKDMDLVKAMIEEIATKRTTK